MASQDVQIYLFASKILLKKIRQEGILWKKYKNA